MLQTPDISHSHNVKLHCSLSYWAKCKTKQIRISFVVAIENRIYREELKESLGMIFFSPFQPERELKVYKSCKCSLNICNRVH